MALSGVLASSTVRLSDPKAREDWGNGDAGISMDDLRLALGSINIDLFDQLGPIKTAVVERMRATTAWVLEKRPGTGDPHGL